MSLTTTLIVVCLSAVQTQIPPAELAIAVRAAQDESLSMEARKKLVGKEYTGAVTIRTVRLRPDGSASVEAEAQSEAGKALVHVRFLTTSNDPVLNSLSRDQVIRVRARLSGFTGTVAAPVIEFTGMSVVTGG